MSSYYSKLGKLGIPVILSQLGQITIGIVDNIMIGELGTDQLASASFANTIFNIVIIFGMGFTYIITPLIGTAHGRKSYSETSSLLKNAVWANFFMSIILTTILVGISFFFDRMGQDPKIVSPARNYFLLINITTIPLMLFYSLKQFADGTGDTRTGMAIVLKANVIHIIGNYIFIHGLWFIPSLGLNGAAIGTIIARLYMLGSFFYCFTIEHKYKKFTYRYHKAQANTPQIISIVKKGFLLGLQTVMEASTFGIACIMVGWLGKVGLAAHQIAISISTLGFMVYQGIGAATTILVSKSVGRRNYKEVNSIVKCSFYLTLPLALAMSLLFIATRFWAPLAFTSDVDVKIMAAEFLFILGIFQIPDALQIIYSSSVRGMSDVKIPTIITIFSYYIVAIPSSYILGFTLHYNQVGIWYGFPIGLSVAAILFYWRFKYLISIHSRHTAKA